MSKLFNDRDFKTTVGCPAKNSVIVWVIKSRRMRWAGHVARMGEERACTGLGWPRIGTGGGRL